VTSVVFLANGEHVGGMQRLSLRFCDVFCPKGALNAIVEQFATEDPEAIGPDTFALVR